MTATINLTAVCITLIICVTLYAMCRMARQDEKKKEKQKEIQVPQFVNSRNRENIKPIRSQQEADLREYVEERVKESGKQ